MSRVWSCGLDFHSLGSLDHPVLLPVTCKTSLLGWLHPVPAAFFCGLPMVLGFPLNLGLHRMATTTRESNPATHCLFSMALWKHGTRRHDLKCVSVMLSKPGPYGQCQQILLPASNATWHPWTKVEEASVCQHGCLQAGNILAAFSVRVSPFERIFIFTC